MAHVAIDADYLESRRIEEECDRERIVVVPETRAQAIARWESQGWLVPGCPGCEERYAAAAGPGSVHGPNHTASRRCDSGKRPHCSCDACW
jgi:hypothetical protein